MRYVCLYSIVVDGQIHLDCAYQEKHYEIQRLVLSLGGPRLAYTIAKALNLPSISTTREHSITPTILPSIGFPLHSKISANLEALHLSGVLQGGPVLRKRGYSLQIDEIALEERPRYDSTRDAIIGMSHENAQSCNLSTVTLEILEAAADALEDGSLSLAKEATFVALAAYDREYYVALPLLISGTNKTEDDVSQAEWIELIINVLEQSPHGEEMYGELWSIGSDGDATRRRALHRVLMQHTLAKSSRLYALLSPLHGLNLQCGSKERTLTIDYKHKFKSASLIELCNMFAYSKFVQILPVSFACRPDSLCLINTYIGCSSVTSSQVNSALTVPSSPVSSITRTTKMSPMPCRF